MPDFLAIFDVDGTLVDSQAIITATMTAAFQDARLDPPAPGDVLALVGISLPQMIGMLMPEADPRAQAEVTVNYRRIYNATVTADAAPVLYPGVEDGLRRLHAAGITLGIATGKSQRGLDRLVTAQGWAPMLATLQCADHHPSKPHPSMIDRALLETATKLDRAVMIGDTTFDMTMAGAAGIAAVGVDWGYHAVDLLAAAGARTIVSNFGDVVRTIEEMAG
ncbi:HAD-IA family hydrolase [Jannaschia rubra]|uniref:HAD-IA family hydrolase n=1 Tax=Jannaschia rubra TaxID=282197 RepID=UPI00248FFC28|nr:HAD-IA family hydrolase [Jannaschia rubra]